ncbi:hypothetical protein IHE44_0000927 [Lamprotornis superbus]|uniref:Uncharacterized protein n=1 Tax=Lamprotornis superbus TaxID=245042 RepID=A0A835NG80_9PASS|nr:hypothetical protein IHE44_0000927 [Lamprotornis superbus]
MTLNPPTYRGRYQQSQLLCPLSNDFVRATLTTTRMKIHRDNEIIQRQVSVQTGNSIKFHLYTESMRNAANITGWDIFHSENMHAQAGWRTVENRQLWRDDHNDDALLPYPFLPHLLEQELLGKHIAGSCLQEHSLARRGHWRRSSRLHQQQEGYKIFKPDYFTDSLHQKSPPTFSLEYFGDKGKVGFWISQEKLHLSETSLLKKILESSKEFNGKNNAFKDPSSGGWKVQGLLFGNFFFPNDPQVEEVVNTLAMYICTP